MRKITTALVVCIAMVGFSVAAKEPPSRPAPTKYFTDSQHPPTLDQATLIYGQGAKVTWSAVIGLAGVGAEPIMPDKPLMPDEAIGEYRDGRQSKTRPYLAPYAQRFGRLAAEIALIGHSIATFLPQTVCPFFDIVRYRSGKCVLVMIGSDDIYNSLRASPRERSSKIFSSIAARSVGAAASRFTGADVKYVAVFVTYGVRDFAEDGATSEPETMGVISPISEALAFKNGEISDNDLLRKSAILLSEAGARSFSRVELSLR